LEIAQAVPSERNCVDFATRRCSTSTNLAGSHWCNVPQQFWWGPLGLSKDCYDIRELLKRFAEQAIDVPSIPRTSHPFSYANDRRPIPENQVRAMMEIARNNAFPVPWELQIYFAGKELQRARPLEVKEVEANISPYAIVTRALSNQEELVAEEIRRGYAGFPIEEAKEEEVTESDEEGQVEIEEGVAEFPNVPEEYLAAATSALSSTIASSNSPPGI
jgi:hypothetical protein